MVDEILEPDDEEVEQDSERDYGELLVEEPPREVDIEDFESPKTISEEEEETVHKTDIQAILNHLIPKLPNERMRKLLQPALVSRVFPDNYTDKHFLLSAALIEEHEPDDENLDVVGIISIVQDVLSKAFEGRHIIDLLELAGVAHEEEMEKLSKELGL